MKFVKGGTLVDINTYELAAPQSDTAGPSAASPAPAQQGQKRKHEASAFYAGLTGVQPAVMRSPPAAPEQAPGAAAAALACAMAPAATQARPKTTASGSALRADNVGFKLLQKHGWAGPGHGLGAAGQGRHEPLPTAANPGRRGLGDLAVKVAQLSSAATLANHPAQQQSQPGLKAAGPDAAERARRKARLDALIAAMPENNEDLETKRKRLQQIWQTEVDEKAGKEFQRLLFKEFSESGSSGTDTNPLRRKNKLTATNPLL